MNGSPFLVIVQEMFPLMPCSALTWLAVMFSWILVFLIRDYCSKERSFRIPEMTTCTAKF